MKLWGRLVLEFTGERVVHGSGDENLFNEHLARYRFAAWLARTMPPRLSILDVGCGSGYGTAEFDFAESVTGIDISGEAIRHCRETVLAGNVRFLQAACETLPFADMTFDVVTAFEVIEHTARWPELLTEARRVLKPGGALFISTPNKSVYSESRAGAGPNPFHVHEFEPDEFRAALGNYFPCVRLWAQNHAEGVSFVPAGSRYGTVDLDSEADLNSADFVLAVCGSKPLAESEPFVFLATAANTLRERRHHIALLEKELDQKTEWLDDLEKAHEGLVQTHDAVEAELQNRNLWAEGLNREIESARTRILELHAEASARLNWIRSLEDQIEHGKTELENLSHELGLLRAAFQERTEWGESLGAQLVVERASHAANEEESRRIISELHERSVRTITELRRTITELEADLTSSRGCLDHANAKLSLVAKSKLIRLGNAIGIGPRINNQE